jgi:hypothetical protein
VSLGVGECRVGGSCGRQHACCPSRSLSDCSVSALPATLVAITVSTPIADVAVGAAEQFTATGTSSDLSTQNLTDAVTWSSSLPGTATVSNSPGSPGLATGTATGATTITATDAASLLSGAAALTVTPVSLPATPAPSIPQLALAPSSGTRRGPVIAQGSGFTPGDAVTVTYRSGVKARKRAATVLCHTVAGSNGAFSCHGAIPRRGRSGKLGIHTIEATATGAAVTSKFTLVHK